MPYDRTSDSTEEWTFLNFHDEKTFKNPEINKSNWHFNKEELHAVALIYFKLQKDAGSDNQQGLPTQSFTMVLHKVFGMADDTLMFRICNAFEEITSVVPLKIWINALSIFLRGSLEEKIKHCWRVYNPIKGSDLRRDQIIQLLKNFVYKHHEEDEEEAIKDLADIIIKKLDKNNDGKISFVDYRTTVLEDPMMLECLGQCLPDTKHVFAFLTTFTDEIGREEDKRVGKVRRK